MSGNWDQLQEVGWQALWTLVIGCSLTIVSAALITRLIQSASVRRVVWRAATLGCALILVCEFVGLSHVIAPQNWVASAKPQTSEQPAGLGTDLQPAGLGTDLQPAGQSRIPIHDAQPSSTNGELVDNMKAFPFEVPPLPLLDTTISEQVISDVPTPLTSESPQHSTPVVQSASSGQRSFTSQLPMLSIALWGGGVIILSLRRCWTYFNLWRFHRRTEWAGVHWKDQVEAIKRGCNCKISVRVRSSNEISGPVTYGVLRATIVVPADLASRFAPAQVDAILAHELGHVVSRDAAWLSLAGWLRVALWWHPLIWSLNRVLAQTSETAADETAAALPDGPKLLAECLVQLGHDLAQPRIGWLSASGNGYRSNLARRVHSLLALKSTPRNLRRRPVTVFVLATMWLMTTVTCAAWTNSKMYPLERGERKMRISTAVRRSMLATLVSLSIANPATADGKKNLSEPPRATQASTVAKQAQAVAIAKQAKAAEEAAKKAEAAAIKQRAAAQKKLHNYSSLRKSKNATSYSSLAKKPQLTEQNIAMLREQIKQLQEQLRRSQSATNSAAAAKKFTEAFQYFGNRTATQQKLAQAQYEKLKQERAKAVEAAAKAKANQAQAQKATAGRYYYSTKKPMNWQYGSSQQQNASEVQLAQLRAAYEALTKAGLQQEAASVKKRIDIMVAAARQRSNNGSSANLEKRVQQLSNELQGVRRELAELRQLIQSLKK